MTMMNQFVFIGLFLSCFFAPGWLLLKTLNIRQHRFLLSFALSYALLISVLTALQFAKLPPSLFAPCILGASIFFGVLWFVRSAWLRYFCKAQNGSMRLRSLQSGLGILIPFAVMIGVFWAYLWWAGPYLEIPSDAWNHVGRFRNAQALINSGQFGASTASPYDVLSHQGENWYLIVAYLMQWSGISLPRVLMPLTIMTVATFCAGIFFCALAVFRPFCVSIWKKGWMAVGAVLFCALTMGTGVFAYIRYYALAPTILNYLLFLSATLVAWDWLSARKWWTNALWLIPLMILTMNVVHSQEVLFTCFMIMGLALANIARWLIGLKHTKPSPNVLAENYIAISVRSVLFGKSLIVAGIAIIAWLGLYFWLRRKNPLIWPDAHTIMPNMPIPAISVPLVFKAFTISPPVHPIARLIVYQFYTFYQTIGCWGFFVYIAFLLSFRQMARSNYLLAGMAMPLLTVFNPITVDLFVRLITLQSPDLSPVTIYRFNYMVPLSFVAALALGNAVASLRLWTRHQGVELSGKRSKAALIKATIIIIGLGGLILPIQNRWIDAPFSRLYTLTTHFGNDVGRWRDLTDFAAGFHNPMLITDPNTSQIFSRLYPEYRLCGLQWMGSNEPEAQFFEATKRQPELWTKGIVVINRRDGVPSVTGRISKHWPEDAFLTSCFYSPKAIDFVESQTNYFKLLWTKDRIQVFQITP